MRIEELLAAPASVDIEFAARAIGIGRTQAYTLIRIGEFPVRVLKIGHRYRIPRQALLEYLQLAPGGTDAA